MMLSRLLFSLLVATTLQPTLGRAESQIQKNEAVVRDFYEQVFNQHRTKEAAEKYLAEGYIQHNPHVATGRQPFIDFFVRFFKKNPESRAEIKRVIGEGDLVVLHVHSKNGQSDLGRAIVDIFRLANGKIVEHWDVIQSVPEKAANLNTMF